jgi:MFS family permease
MIDRIARRLPFFYGWIIVAVVFITMALGVNARTAFSLLMPPILDEFGWERGVTAGVFSFGFLVTGIMGPLIGRMMDLHGPRWVMGLGIAATGTGLLLATLGSEPWHLYLTLGVLVGAGSSFLGYTGQALFLPHWFARRRGLAIGIAYAGVGAGSILLFPWLQDLIAHEGWRTACITLGVVVLILTGPLNVLLLRRRPQDLGLQPDGDAEPGAASATKPASQVVDAAWVAVDWTLARAVRTARFWWIATALFGGLYAWYAVQVHQTQVLVEAGFQPAEAAWALGAVSLAGIPGQILLGHLSDRMGREIVWTLGCLGFVLTYFALLMLGGQPNWAVLWIIILAQGFLGYGITPVFGAVPAEIFQGKHLGTIFGVLMLGGFGGGALGPWVMGALHDLTGHYDVAFATGIAASALSIVAIWKAAPRKVRVVAGRVRPGR